MTIAELKRAKDVRPFLPFLINMADGRALEIRHPDAVAWGDENGRFAVCVLPDSSVEVIDVSLATSLSIPAPAGGEAGSNGGE
jgi:hypothetical protein